MKTITILFLLTLIAFPAFPQNSLRHPVDTIGFATRSSQMDSVIKRIGCFYNVPETPDGSIFRMAICPHDDYAYAGYLYGSVLSHIKAKTVIILGVAHKARVFNVEQKLVFDSFKEWKEPYGNIKISPLREEIMKNLPSADYIIHDSLQQAEHSTEAIIPFLQYYNRNVNIISVLVPYMDFETMKKYSGDLAGSISLVMKKNKLEWGNDIAIVISNDAVHYGDQDWGGQNYARYGTDTAGYEKALNHEKEIISECLAASPDTSSAHRFFRYTVDPVDWHTYLWTWCGRYSVPFGLMTGMYLGKLTGSPLQNGIPEGYGTSISHPSLHVKDLKMGTTAVANLHHWVGYAAIGYK